MYLVLQYRVNKCVFSSLLKLLLLTLRSLKLSGNEFQAYRPAIEKAVRLQPLTMTLMEEPRVFDWWIWDATRSSIRDWLAEVDQSAVSATSLSRTCVPVITRAAAFVTRWSLSVVTFGAPNKRALLYNSWCVTWPCRVNAEASRSLRYWRWRRIDRG